MRTRLRGLAVAFVGTTFVGALAACSGSAKSSGLAVAPGNSAQAGPEPAGGERPAGRVVHTSGWRIDSPGTMTATSDGGAAYQGPSDFLRVTSLAGSSDP